MKYMSLLIIALALFAGCQTENTSIIITDEGSAAATNPATVKYEGNTCTAAKVFIIKIDRSPISHGQDMKDSGNPDIEIPTGL